MSQQRIGSAPSGRVLGEQRRGQADKIRCGRSHAGEAVRRNGVWSALGRLRDNAIAQLQFDKIEGWQVALGVVHQVAENRFDISTRKKLDLKVRRRTGRAGRAGRGNQGQVIAARRGQPHFARNRAGEALPGNLAGEFERLGLALPIFFEHPQLLAVRTDLAKSVGIGQGD